MAFNTSGNTKGIGIDWMRQQVHKVEPNNTDYWSWCDFEEAERKGLVFSDRDTSIFFKKVLIPAVFSASGDDTEFIKTGEVFFCLDDYRTYANPKQKTVHIKFIIGKSKHDIFLENIAKLMRTDNSSEADIKMQCDYFKSIMEKNKYKQYFTIEV